MDVGKRLGIGTAAFGLDYGISNSDGLVPLERVNKILEIGLSKGFSVIDTARLYGIAEERLGMLSVTHKFPKIVTKFPEIQRDASEIGQHLRDSIKALNVEGVYGLLAHRASDLMGEKGKESREILEKLRETGLVERYGVSAYSPREVERVFEGGDVGIVQVPLSIFDQRFITSGWLKELERRGVEVHVRSVYLQGLAFMDVANLPDFFASIRSNLVEFHQMVEESECSVEQICLQFVLMQPEVTSAIVGFTHQSQIDAIRDVCISPQIPWDDFRIEEECFVNPALWQLERS